MLAVEMNLKSNDSEKPVATEIEMFALCQQEEQRLRDHVQNKILKSLRYPTMTDRYEQIIEAYQQAYDWVFQLWDTA